MEIAKHSQVDRIKVSKILQKLEAKNYLLRIEHESDIRAKSISLTKAGETVLQKALKKVEAVDIQFFSILGKKQNDFNKNLRQLITEKK